MTTTVTTVTESVTPVTVIVIQSQLLSSSHSYRHNAAISAARATYGQHKGPNMMMFSPLYQQRSAAASKLRVRNIRSGPVWTSLNQSGPARTGLEQLKPVRNLQSGTIRLKPVQTNPAESKTSSQNQPEPVRTGLEQLAPVRNLQSGTIRLRPVQNGWLRLHSSVRLPTAPRSRLRRHRRFRHERIRQAQPEQPQQHHQQRHPQPHRHQSQYRSSPHP